MADIGRRHDEGLSAGPRASGAVPRARGGRRACAVGATRCQVHHGVRGHLRLAGRAPALSVLTVFLRLAWRTVAGIVARVVADGRATNDLLTGLARIGIDEISYRKGHRYLTVIVDHGTGRLVWAAEGRNKDTLEKFFDELGAERAAKLTHVSADGAEWIHAVVAQRAPNAVICLDPFHVVAWALKALDKVRVRTMAKAGISDRHAMWAVRKNPADLTCEQRTSLASITTTNNTLYRAYLLKSNYGKRSSQRTTRPTAAGGLAVVGVAFPHPRIRRPGPQHPPLPGPDPQHPRPQRQQRPLGSDEHSPAGTDQTRLRLPQPRGPDRHGPTHPRRSLPGATRPKMTHYNVSRSTSSRWRSSIVKRFAELGALLR